MQGQGLAIIPLDLPGISRGKPLDKMGQRPLNQGSIIFEDARIPKRYMVIPNSDFINASGGQGLAAVNGRMSIVFAGLAKAAFDEAFRYSQERIQGGSAHLRAPHHQAQAHEDVHHGGGCQGECPQDGHVQQLNPFTPAVTHAVAAKCFSTETATFVASEAMQIFGGYGLAKEYPIEKMYRDARASMIEDGVNEALAIKATEYWS